MKRLMHYPTVSLFLFLPYFLSGQAADSIRIKTTIDTLVNQAHDKLQEYELDKALELQIEATNLSYDLYGEESKHYAKMSSYMAKMLISQEK